jgi:hypothetical protein
MPCSAQIDLHSCLHVSAPAACRGSTGAMGSQGYKGQAFTAAPKTATAVPL